MPPLRQLCFLIVSSILTIQAQCPDYLDYSAEYHAPFSSGKYNLSYQRPAPACRTFNSSGVEAAIARVAADISDPDLARLFENAYPNTLDTAIRWKGFAAGSNDEEELTFVITGDINAMWLRDSANQMQSYLPLLNASSAPDSIASLYRGVINLQARYLLAAPYCQAFQPPVESGIGVAINPSASDDVVFPTYDNQSVFECKFVIPLNVARDWTFGLMTVRYELDSLAAFLEVSTNYYTATQDSQFFAKCVVAFW